MNMTLCKSFFVILCLLLIECFHTIHAELKIVSSIPGYDSSGYMPKMYSGYVTTKVVTSKIFSILVLADETPEDKPLVVFQNGGPGASSLQGFIIENGPILLEGDGRTVHTNPDRWNAFANVLYMELPGGVGFSTSNVEKWNDELFSKNFIEALLEVKQQFPQFINKKNPVWLTGESYAGAYLSRTMHYIVTNTDGLGLDFKGLFIGNGVTNRKIEDMTAPLYMREHMLISDVAFEGALNDCDGDFRTETENCRRAQENLWLSVFMSGINPYNLYDTCIPVNITATLLKSSVQSLDRSKFLSMNGVQERIFGDQPLPQPCVSIKQIEHFFNIPSVQSALHVDNIPQKWSIVNEDLSSKYRSTVDSTAYYLPILQKKIAIRHYSGDCDLIVNTRGTISSLEEFAYLSNFTISTKWQTWKDRNDRNGGFQIGWSGNNTEEVRIITVRGGGHMAASNRARQVVDLLKRFISEKL